MSHDVEIANLMTFANAEGLNITQRALLRQAAERLEWCDERIFALEQAASAHPEPAQAQVSDTEVEAPCESWLTKSRWLSSIDEVRKETFRITMRRALEEASSAKPQFSEPVAFRCCPSPGSDWTDWCDIKRGDPDYAKRNGWLIEYAYALSAPLPDGRS